MKKAAVTIFCLLLAACSEDKVGVPEPTSLTDDAISHYDQMFVVDHDGPKAQIHLAGAEQPLWFSQVRDGVAYIKSEERTAEILAFYVNDMGDTDQWADPGADNWVDGQTAIFVMGSDAVGGMGSPEMVPFADQAAAQRFADHRGGHLVSLADIDPGDALLPVEMSQMPDHAPTAMPATGHDHKPTHAHPPVTQ